MAREVRNERMILRPVASSSDIVKAPSRIETTVSIKKFSSVVPTDHSNGRDQEKETENSQGPGCLLTDLELSGAAPCRTGEAGRSC